MRSDVLPPKIEVLTGNRIDRLDILNVFSHHDSKTGLKMGINMTV